MMLAAHPFSRLLLWLSSGVAVCGVLAFAIALHYPALSANTTKPDRTGSAALVTVQTPTPARQSGTTGSGTGFATTTLSRYFQVTDSCGPYFDGAPCLNMRSGPGDAYPVVRQLRNGVLLKIADSTTTPDGKTWYRIGYDGDIHYPERVLSGWYVAADLVHPFLDQGMIEETPSAASEASSTKRIVIKRSAQMLYAYDGDTLFMQQAISTGLHDTPTPLGKFHIFRKMPDSYMQGPVPGVSAQYYDLPGVPWDMYFTNEGAAIHGAYWHNHFGEPWSHGCVNLPVEKAKMLYEWAPLGTPVTVEP